MKTSQVILVSYTTRPRKGVESAQPEMVADRRLKDVDKIAQDIATKAKSWKIRSSRTPYLGELDRVYMALASDIDSSKYKEFDLEVDSGPLGPRIADAIQEWFPDHFAEDTGCLNDDLYPVRFVGFDIRTFVKMLASECAEHGDNILPHSLWYGSDHRDLTKALIPSQPGCADISLGTIASRLGIPLPLDCLKDYTEGEDVQLDAMVAAYAVQRLNLFPFANKALSRIARALHDNVTEEALA